jgi:hypothetical protein
MHIDLAIPHDKPFDVVGVGIDVIGSLFRIPPLPGPNAKDDGPPADGVDTASAGGVFHGPFLCGLLQGREAGDILRFANAVSTLDCTRLGGRSGIPTCAEAQEFLHARAGQTSAESSGKEP